MFEVTRRTIFSPSKTIFYKICPW